MALHAAAKSVVITGASSGIGKSTALLMAQQGWQVFAGVRKPSDGEALQQLHTSSQGSITPIIVDVTQPETITAAAEQVRAALQQGQVLTGLVNNAGKVTLAPLEFMPPEVFEDMLQVNLVGVLRVTQAFLPLMRPHPTAATAGSSSSSSSPVASQQQTGRVVNISSQAGTVALPLFGGYCASKFGLEAVSDTLRYELHGQGIDVVCIKPGAVKSDIWARGHDASGELLKNFPPVVEQLYGNVIKVIGKATRVAEDKGGTCDEVAQLISTALTVDKPRARYLFGKDATVQMVARRLLPDWIWDPAFLKALSRYKDMPVHDPTSSAVTAAQPAAAPAAPAAPAAQQTLKTVQSQTAATK